MTDREKLVNILKSQPYGYHTYDEMADYLIANGVTINAQISMEDKLSENNINVKLVKHGEWVECKEIFNDEQELVDAINCSQCGKSQRVFRRTPYCPSCGAKMDGGKES